MIALGMAALFAEFEPGPQAADLGLTLARYILETHVNLGGRWPQFREYDLVEFVDAAGDPWADESGRIVSDPGHSLEFVGLFLKFSRAVRRCGGATPAQQEAIRGHRADHARAAGPCLRKRLPPRSWRHLQDGGPAHPAPRGRHDALVEPARDDPGRAGLVARGR